MMGSFYQIDMTYTVYMHKNKINNKVYIGITRRKPHQRWGNGSGYKQNSYFYNAIKKYGWDNFEHIILFENLHPDDAYKKEQELIALFKSNHKEYGYNRSIGGEFGSLGVVVSEETKEKIRKARTGKNLSDEAKEKDRLAHLGSKNAMWGKPSPKRGRKFGALSESHKEKLREKSNPKMVMCIELNIIYESISQAERETGINKGSIANACIGRTQSAGKKNNQPLHWKYL